MAIGIDGCKAGWVLIHGEEIPVLKILSNITQIQNYYTTKDVVLIDIPIGLPSRDVVRKVETKARAVLGKRSSTIFNVPCRGAVYSSSFKEANRINRVILDKGLSIQSWNIVGKIREVDQFLLDNPTMTTTLLESHPEICFQFLNPSNQVLNSKKTSSGQSERLQILETHVNGITKHYEKFISWAPRSKASQDDIIDALALWVTAKFSSQYSLSKLGENNNDENAISMNMHFINPYGKDL